MILPERAEGCGAQNHPDTFLPLDYIPPERIVLIVGNYGSGKTEVAVNLAIRLAEQHRVSIADLDIVNPYFRCREARQEMEDHGIRVIYPHGEYHAADLPIILPEIRGAILEGQDFLILDVGGDDVGARVLSSLADLLVGRACAMLQVLNARRPFTDTVAGALKIRREIEAASRLPITGLISNTHLLEQTDVATVMEGLALARAVGREAGLPVRAEGAVRVPLLLAAAAEAERQLGFERRLRVRREAPLVFRRGLRQPSRERPALNPGRRLTVELGVVFGDVLLGLGDVLPGVRGPLGPDDADDLFGHRWAGGLCYGGDAGGDQGTKQERREVSHVCPPFGERRGG